MEHQLARLTADERGVWLRSMTRGLILDAAALVFFDDSCYAFPFEYALLSSVALSTSEILSSGSLSSQNCLYNVQQNHLLISSWMDRA